jgi:hypothetical protein
MVRAPSDRHHSGWLATVGYVHPCLLAYSDEEPVELHGKRIGADFLRKLFGVLR